MADTVGAMYVRVLADTSGLKKEMESKGDKAGADFGKSFNRTFNNKLNKDLGKGQAFRNLDKSIDAWAKKMAQTIADADPFDTIRFDIRDVISTKDLKRLKTQFNLTTDEISEHFLDRMSVALLGAQDELDRSLAQSAAKAAKQAEKVAKAAEKASKQVQKEAKRSWGAAFKEWRNAYKLIDDEGARAQARLALISRSFKRIGRDAGDVDLSFKKWRRSLKSAGTGGWFDSLTNAMAGVLGISGAFGRMVPKSINLVSGSISKLGTVLVGKGGKLAELGGTLLQVGGAFSKLGKGGPAAIAALAGAVVAATSVIGALVAVVNALAAGFVALGSAILYTVANLALLVPVLGALGVGFGALVIGALDAGQAVGKLWTAVNETDPKKQAEAWKDYNRELEKLGPNARAAVQEMKPLVKQFSGLKKVAGEALFEGMAAALKKATPLVEAIKGGIEEVARAVGDVIEQFLALAQNTTFMESFNKMWATSAVIIRDVGSVAVNLFRGFTNFFAAISPLVEQFTGSLAKATEEFAKWTETEGGRQAILDFFTKAYEIGSLVWSVVKELGLALFDLFTSDAATQAGADLFNWLLEKVQAFRKWINEAAEDGRLKKWFEDAKFVAKGLWSIVEQIGALFKTFSSEEYRVGFVIILALIKSMIFSFQVLAFTGKLGLGLILGAVKLLKAGFDNLKKAIQAVVDWIKKIKFPSLPGWVGKLNPFGRSGGGARAAVLAFPGPMNVGVPGGAGTVTNYWNITTPAADGRVVASQVMNRMAAMAG